MYKSQKANYRKGMDLRYGLRYLICHTCILVVGIAMVQCMPLQSDSPIADYTADHVCISYISTTPHTASLSLEEFPLCVSPATTCGDSTEGTRANWFNPVGIVPKIIIGVITGIVIGIKGWYMVGQTRLTVPITNDTTYNATNNSLLALPTPIASSFLPRRNLSHLEKKIKKQIVNATVIYERRSATHTATRNRSTIHLVMDAACNTQISKNSPFHTLVAANASLANFLLALRHYKDVHQKLDIRNEKSETALEMAQRCKPETAQALQEAIELFTSEQNKQGLGRPKKRRKRRISRKFRYRQAINTLGQK